MDVLQFFNEVFDKEEIQDIALFFGLSTTGKKTEIIKRIVTSSNFDINELLNHFNREQLYLLNFNLRLPTSGTKTELWERIVQRFGLDKEIFIPEESNATEASTPPQIDEQKLEEKQIDEDKTIDEEIQEITEIINKWIPDRRYNNEEGYQAELSTLLKHKHGFKVQSEVGATQVDILVNETIPIELKKNPNRGDFDRLSGQIFRNINKYGKLIVVICKLETQELFMEYKYSFEERYSSNELIFIIK